MTQNEKLEEKFNDLVSKRDTLASDIEKHRLTIEKAEERLVNREINQDTYEHIKTKRETAIKDLNEKLSELELNIEDIKTELHLETKTLGSGTNQKHLPERSQDNAWTKPAPPPPEGEPIKPRPPRPPRV
jgi:chromosome segregation ATPase